MTPEELIRLKRTLETSLDSFGSWMEFWTAVVVLGLLIEYVPEIISTVRKVEFRSSLHTIIGGVLITGGVAGELIVGAKASGIETRLRGVNDSIAAVFNTEAANARREASLAIERAAKANERAANAERETARLNKMAEDERLARMKIEEQFAWRNLNEASRQRIVAKIAPFRGQQFDIITYFDDRESVNLFEQVASTLTAAHWVPTRSPTFGIGFIAEVGITIRVVPILGSVSDSARAAEVLASALNAERITTVVKHGVRAETDTAPIQVRVGKDPKRP